VEVATFIAGVMTALKLADDRAAFFLSPNPDKLQLRGQLRVVLNLNTDDTPLPERVFAQ